MLRADRRAFLAPEVLQTSGMDCGPAAMHSLLTGIGVAAEYDELREACQTSTDGTSIDAIEDLCLDRGLEAYQEMVPVPDASEVLTAKAPCIVAVKGVGGSPHFVLVWRRVGDWFQIMDPSRGRRWVRSGDFERELHTHAQRLSAEAFASWFPSTGWGEVLWRRAKELGEDRDLDAASCRELAAVDSAARACMALRGRGGPSMGERKELYAKLRERLQAGDVAGLPDRFVALSASSEGGAVIQGVVYLVVRDPAARSRGAARPPRPPGAHRLLLGHLSVSGRSLVSSLAARALLVACLSLLELVLIRAAFNAGSVLTLPLQRTIGALSYVGVVIALFAAELWLNAGAVMLARSLETRLHVAMREKLPRLPDRYFRLRPSSDIAHRAQGLFEVRALPELAVQVGKNVVDVVLTGLALCILYPAGALYVVGAVGVALFGPVLATARRRTLELRAQTHASALNQLYLDVLRGLAPIRAHGGQVALRGRQGLHMSDWRAESTRSIGVQVGLDLTQGAGMLLFIGALLVSYVSHHPEQQGLLLLAFWALRLPLYGRALTGALQKAPAALAATTRLVEPLRAREVADDASGTATEERAGPELVLEGAKVVAAGQVQLDASSVTIRSGQHVAVVGCSGAGKSTLIGVLLGLVELSEGRLEVDGVPLDDYGRTRLRRQAVWIDPTVQLWNRSLLANLRFGNGADTSRALGSVLRDLDLDALVDRLPHGLRTNLGEGGALVSGGEGQRVRVARGLLRRDARLFLLDEAFRGVERPVRRALSRRLRAEHRGATLLEVTHDVADTMDFDRILVVEDGRIMEDGPPAELAANRESRYAALLRADREAAGRVFGDRSWRRVSVRGGRVSLDRSPEAR